MQVVQKDLMDMLVKELKEELEARDQRPRPAQQGMAAPEAAHGAIVVRAARASRLAEPESHIE